MDPRRPPSSDVLAPFLVGVLCVGFSASMYHPFFALRAAVLVVAAGPALVVLVRQAHAEWGARFALLFLGAATASTITSPRPAAALWGEPGAGTGFLFVAACTGLWAWGRTFTDVAVDRTRRVLLVGVVANVVVAAFQKLDVVPAILAMVDRPFGLTGNAVHLGALCAAAVAVAAPRFVLRSPFAPLAVGVAAAGVELSGGRSALGLLVLAVAVVAVRGRFWWSALLVIASAAAGVGLAGAIPGEAPSATARTAAGDSSGSFQPRIEAWRSASVAAAERPIVGHGPGRFRAAVSPQRTREAARLDGDRPFGDAHNLFIELAVTTGALGLLTFLLWLGWVAREARGPWAYLALILLLAHLVEPLSVVTTPLMAMALGIAARRHSRPDITSPRGGAVAGAVAAALGAAAAVSLLYGEVQLQRGSEDFDRDALGLAERALPSTWPTVPLVTVRVQGFYGAQDPTARAAALAAGRRAVSSDPTDDRSWTRLAGLEGVWGSKEAAEAAYRQALRRNPWSIDALRGMAQLAEEQGDDDQARSWCGKVRQVTAAGRCAGRPMREW